MLLLGQCSVYIIIQVSLTSGNSCLSVKWGFDVSGQLFLVYWRYPESVCSLTCRLYVCREWSECVCRLRRQLSVCVEWLGSVFCLTVWECPSPRPDLPRLLRCRSQCYLLSGIGPEDSPQIHNSWTVTVGVQTMPGTHHWGRGPQGHSWKVSPTHSHHHCPQ